MRERFTVSHIPSFEFAANDANERVRAPALLAFIYQPSFDRMAVPAVLIAHYDEAYAGLLPSSKLPGNALFQMRLPLVGNALKRQIRE